MEITDQQFQEVIKFHGHTCPGIAYGIKVSLCALEKLGPRAVDEELVAIVENDACPVDAVQVLTGCTFGKGNLIFKNFGKQVYTFFSRLSGEGIRLSLKDVSLPETDADKKVWKTYQAGDRSSEILEAIEQRKSRRIKQILNAPADKLFEIATVSDINPDKARILPSVECTTCHEKVMETKARVKNGQFVCIPCADEAASF